MASVNVSEEEFRIVSNAANHAHRRGYLIEAQQLDKLARKINAALTNSSGVSSSYGAPNMKKKFTWKDMPSTLLPSLLENNSNES